MGPDESFQTGHERQMPSTLGHWRQGRSTRKTLEKIGGQFMLEIVRSVST